MKEAKGHARTFAYVISLHPHTVGISIPILHRKKKSQRRSGTWFAKLLTAGLISNPGMLDSKAHALSTTPG